MRSTLLAALLVALAAAPSLPRAAGRARTAGARAPDAKVRAFVQSRTGSLQRCYEDTLREKPFARGKMRVRMTVATDGAVREVTVVRNELGAEMAECVRATIEAWKTPFRLSEAVIVEMPFAFEPVE